MVEQKKAALVPLYLFKIKMIYIYCKKEAPNHLTKLLMKINQTKTNRQFPGEVFHNAFLLTLIFAFCHHFSHAQNLVPNSTFSEFDSTGFHFWKDVVNKKPYSYRAGKGIDTAAYLVMDEQGKSPNSSTYFFSQENGMLVRLKEPLAAGAYYKIKLKARQADSSLLIVNNLGVYFSNKKDPDALLSLSGVNASDGWQDLAEVYLAKGGEQYLYVGKMSTAGIETSWNNRFKKKKYGSQWDLRKDGYKHIACYIIDDVVLEKIPVNPSFSLAKKFVPENILFETAKADLSEKAEYYLLVLASFLRTNENILISIEGFADERGSGDYNIQLSKNRAVGVANFLLRHGVAKNRIQLRWHGSEKASRKESEYHLDRKIQIELVSKAEDLQLMEH